MGTRDTPGTAQLSSDAAVRSRDGASEQASPLDAVLTAMVSRRLWYGARPATQSACGEPQARQTGAVRRRLARL